ncbi:GNAT family N-acetyltransferase [Lactobacillaceae bacterium Melli_B4]
MKIRPATAGDAQQLLAIYAPYITKTTISFEYQVPSLSEFKSRIEATLVDYPYLVAEADGGQILGYVYAHRYKSRAAYDWTVETSIYLAGQSRGMGIGKQLYQALEAALRKQNVTTLLACVTGENMGSVRFHEHLGYQLVGNFQQVGYKNGQSYNTFWLEKIIGAPTGRPLIPYSEIY